MLSLKDALGLAKTCSKYHHMLLASKLMKKLAVKLGEDRTAWELVGLLHDLDFDEVRGDMRKHGVVAAERLKDELPEHCLYAIKAHDYRAGFIPKSRLGTALVAVDSLAVLLEANQAEFNDPDVQGLKDTLKRLVHGEPWLKSNIQKYQELGLSMDDFLSLAQYST